MENAIELRGLTKRYGDFELKGLNLKLPLGTIMGFIGENGAGKTTTIRLMLGHARPDEGEIYLLGQQVGLGDDRAVKARIAAVFDESNFPPSIRARDVSAIMRSIYKSWDASLFERRCRELTVPLDKPVKDCSRGTRMKLSLAAALSHRAELLILDEPTSGLDPVVRDEILDLFLDFISDGQHSIFVSSHITSDLERAADYIAFLHKGRLVLNEPKDELSERYAVIHCTSEEFAALEPSAVVGSRRNSFGVDALVLRERVASGRLERASIEDIMLYNIRGDRS